MKTSHLSAILLPPQCDLLKHPWYWPALLPFFNMCASGFDTPLAFSSSYSLVPLCAKISIPHVHKNCLNAFLLYGPDLFKSLVLAVRILLCSCLVILTQEEQQLDENDKAL